MSALLSVVTVNHGSAAEVGEALAALRAAEPGLALEPVVVDNPRIGAGEEGAVECERAALRALGARVPGLVLLENAVNEGFAAAANRGARRSRGGWLLFLNADVRVRPGSIRRLLEEAARHPEAAVLAPRLENLDGSPQWSGRTFYRARTVLVRRTPLRRWLRGSGEDRRHLMADRDPAGAHEVDWAIGACLLVSAADFQALGGFDERFFLYFEDVDLCLRAWQRGRTVRYVGGSAVVHAHRRQSAGPLLARARLHHAASFLRFVAKHGGLPSRASALRRLATGRPLVFVNQGRGALGERARRFATALGGSVLAKDGLAGGRGLRALRAAATVLARRPAYVHVLDVGIASCLVEAAARLAGSRVTLDTGDAHYELRLRTLPPSLLDEVHGAVERLAIGLADALVVRGRGHVAALADLGYNDVRWIPDGADVALYARAAPHPWREARGWEGALVVASVGSLLVDERHGVTQGSELVEALALVPDARGAIVGDGPGRALLEARIRALGLEGRVALLGRRDPEELLPSLLKSFDVCLSTQSDDAVGRARTTGKLPLFCAAGRYVLASDVGEASRVLPPEMRVPYAGSHDPGYPARLAGRLAELAGERGRLGRGAGLVEVAKALFDYPRLEEQVRALAGAALCGLPGAALPGRARPAAIREGEAA